jgi:FG-GAP-like repeat
VQHADHWAYNARHATGLVDGSIFGHAGEGSLVGYECDGAAFEQDPSNPAYVRPTGADGTPRNFVIIGKAELTPTIYAGVGYGDGVDEPFHKRWGVLPRENTLYVTDASGSRHPRLEGPYMATMGSYSRYGTVFTAATTDWVRGLCAHQIQSQALRERTEPGRPVIWGRDPVDKITRNVLDTLSHRRLNAVGMGDFDGDGKDDLLLQNQTTGDLVYWRMDGTTRLSQGSILYDGFYPPGSYLPSGSDINVPRWKVVGVADFNGDGKPDVLFQHALSGELSYWLLDGTERTRAATITYDGSYPPGTDWKVVGVADLNADGQPDILFQNQLTGELSVWYLEEGHRITTSAIQYDGTSAPGVEWKAVGLADFNGDLRPEILFQSQVTGELSCWVLSGDTRTGILPITHDGTYSPGVDWKVVALGSWNENGQTDILFQNRNNGLLSYWLMNGSQRLLSGAPTPASPWTT